jgi:hypothetical protein
LNSSMAPLESLRESSNLPRRKLVSKMLSAGTCGKRGGSARGVACKAACRVCQRARAQAVSRRWRRTAAAAAAARATSCATAEAGAPWCGSEQPWQRRRRAASSSSSTSSCTLHATRSGPAAVQPPGTVCAPADGAEGVLTCTPRCPCRLLLPARTQPPHTRGSRRRAARHGTAHPDAQANLGASLCQCLGNGPAKTLRTARHHTGQHRPWATTMQRRWQFCAAANARPDRQRHRR